MLVRFLSRGFHNGSIVEPGEVISVADDTFLGRHMVRLEGDNDHIVGAQPAFQADLAYSLDPVEVRAQLTEEAIKRAEATRLREAEEEHLRVEASTGEQPSIESAADGKVDAPVSPEVSDPLPDSPDKGGDAADG